MKRIVVAVTVCMAVGLAACGRKSELEQPSAANASAAAATAQAQQAGQPAPPPPPPPASTGARTFILDPLIR